jgi:MFS family permease
VSSTPARPHNYRWTILGAGVFAQAAFSAILLGLPAIAPAIQDRYALSLTQIGVVLAALNIGSLATLLLWGIVADRIGERSVIAIGQVGTAAALVWRHTHPPSPSWWPRCRSRARWERTSTRQAAAP